MRTLEEIDADIQVHINAIAEICAERDQVSPNPIKVRLVPGAEGITISKG